MRIEDSLELLEQCLELSLKHGWNIQFHVPDLPACYSDLKLKPVITWYIWNELRKEREE